MEPQLERPKPGTLLDLYVAGRRGPALSKLTLDALHCAQGLRGQGVAIGIFFVRPGDLKDPRVIDALRRCAVDKLPALLEGRRSHVGLEAIRGYCAAVGRPPTSVPAPADRSAAYSFQEPGAGRGLGVNVRHMRAAGPGQEGDRQLSGHEDLSENATDEETATADLEAFYAQEIRAERGDSELNLSEMGTRP